MFGTKIIQVVTIDDQQGLVVLDSNGTLWRTSSNRPNKKSDWTKLVGPDFSGPEHRPVNTGPR